MSIVSPGPLALAAFRHRRKELSMSLRPPACAAFRHRRKDSIIVTRGKLSARFSFLELDETLTSREIINTKIRVILDEATDPWGIKVGRVEVKNILPPKDIQEAMEKQMRAERERRSVILTAEGEKRAAILKAEGEKESVILRAIAKKESMITEAEGEAQALERVYKAQAFGVEIINKAKPEQAYLTLKSLESLEKVANGNATKIIIPSELQNLAGLIASIKGVAEDDKK